MTVNLPIDKKALPFLDRQGVKYQESDLEARFPTQTWITIESTMSNLTDFSWAMRKFGRHEALKLRLNYPNVSDTFISPIAE